MSFFRPQTSQRPALNQSRASAATNRLTHNKANLQDMISFQ